MGTATIDDASIEGLRGDFRGDLIRPGDPSYDQARAVFNGMIDRRPGLVARCTGTADVIAALGFARERDLQVAVRGGGHSVAGFSTCDDGIVIDLSPMRGVRVDPDARTARAQAGCRWGDLDRETQVYGLATPGGLVSTTGIAGLTLGGGFGFLTLKHGMSCDNLIAADVVTADGRVVVSGEKDNAELLWGLRGGGGNFGIVTSFEYRLHEVPEVTVGLITHPIDAAADLLRFLRDAEVPEEMALFAGVMTIPAEPPMPIFPEELLGTQVIALIGAWPGPDGEQAFAPVRAFGTPSFELVMPMPYTMAQSMQDDDAPWGSRNYWKSAYVSTLSDDLIDAIASRAPGAPSPRTQVSIGRLGGAVAKVPEDATAFPLRDAGFIVQMDAIWDDAAADDENIAWNRALSDAVAPFALDRVYVNFIGDEGAERTAAAYGEKRYQRLVALKDEYDPTNVFRLNQNITPST